ncbi:MAG TPA: polyprenyl synthetase family protein [Patescibacteria group bacterium]|nr:polyprenyl synthetase family protein [Patescibacteria group bacterium]
MATDLLTSLTEFSQVVHTTTVSFFEEQEKIAADIDDNLLHSLKELAVFSERGGKAIRAYLVEVGYELAQGKPSEDLVKAATAIDLHHKHILILDDIADRDEERYGGPTVEYSYRKYFADQDDSAHSAQVFAMLDGVWLGALARELLYESGFTSDKLIACTKLLNTLMYRDTLAGWQIHALECKQTLAQSTTEEFVKGLELVTARYTFEGPLKIGLILAGNTNKKVTIALEKYSKYVGTAFQIQDDILGLFGDSAKTGKPVGNDVREGKKTLLVQIAYQRTNEKEFLESCVGNAKITPEDIAQVQKIVKDTGSLKYSQDLAQKYVSEGIETLSDLPDSESKQHLIDLARYVIKREK